MNMVSNRQGLLRRKVAALLLCVFALQSVVAAALPCGSMTVVDQDAATHEAGEHSGHHADHASSSVAGKDCCSEGGFCSASICLVPAALVPSSFSALPVRPEVFEGSSAVTPPIHVPLNLFRPPIHA